jgi:hypothetical protein
MTITIPRGESDKVIERIIACLRNYEADHPRAQIDLYRQNVVSVRIRIIDPDFAGLGRSERSQNVWEYLEKLSDDDAGDISSLLLLAPEETKKSFANMEFEDPVPSQL